MKKFNFPLNTVLNYKDQVLDNLISQHAQILVRVAGQEKKISQMEEMKNSACIKLKKEKETGIAINTMREYEAYIMNIEKIILAEQKALAVLKEKEEQKRAQVVEARKEKASIEKLKEKKLMQYEKEVQRSEELFIEEFVSNIMSVRNNR
ncbi:MAG: flagellar export protein FliJ [Hungatella sp.]|jgi:flagellar FliJ protein|nr:flagellar export protein FliJ [Hungatella sp.]